MRGFFIAPFPRRENSVNATSRGGQTSSRHPVSVPTRQRAAISRVRGSIAQTSAPFTGTGIKGGLSLRPHFSNIPLKMRMSAVRETAAAR